MKSLILLFVFASKAYGQGDCSESSAIKHPAFVIGIGGGETLDQAKQAATADMLGFFNTKIEAGTTMETTDHSDDKSSGYQSSLTTRITTSTAGVAKGVEVLATCRNESELTIVVGVRKKMVKDLLIKDATERSAALNDLFKKVAVANSKSGSDRSLLAPAKVQLVAILAQESKAVETWVLLGLEATHFPVLSKKIIEDIRTYVRNHQVSYRVLPTGILAEKSLSRLKHFLSLRGFEFSDAKDAVPMSWMCDLSTFDTVGTATRFKVSCRIVGDETILEPLNIESISSSSQLEDAALRLILAKFDQRT